MNSVNKKINHYCLAKVARGTYVGPSNCYRFLKQDGGPQLRVRTTVFNNIVGVIS